MSYVTLRAVEATDEAAFDVEHCRTEEPLAGGEDYVVEILDLRSPRLVEFVEKKVEGSRYIIVVRFLGTY